LNGAKIDVLRLGHRIERDKRLSTHVGLSSALFNVENWYYSGEHDEHLEESISSVAKRWGAPTKVVFLESPYKFIRHYSGTTVHLTMYGAPHKEVITELREENLNRVLIIVGGPKVPGHVYGDVDYNCAVGYFPHSEVSALAIFLYELLGDEIIYAKDPNAEMKLQGGEKGWGKKQKRRGLKSN